MKTIETVQKFDWNVNQTPVFVNGESVPAFKAIVRDDDGSVLNICNVKYRVFDNVELAGLANTVSDITGFGDVTFQAIKGGKITLAYLKNPDPEMKIGDFKIRDYMVLGNSFNGQTGLFLGTSQVVIRCSNAFGRIFQGVKIRHTNSLSIRVEELKEAIQGYMIEKQKMFVTMEKFMKVPIDQKIIDDCTAYVFKLNDQEKLEKEPSTRMFNKIALLNRSIAHETNEVGNTLWGLFSGFTHFTTHEVEQRNGNSLGNMFGGVNEINQRAYTFAELLAV